MDSRLKDILNKINYDTLYFQELETAKVEKVNVDKNKNSIEIVINNNYPNIFNIKKFFKRFF